LRKECGQKEKIYRYEEDKRKDIVAKGDHKKEITFPERSNLHAKMSQIVNGVS
jgi:hypothetical protein